jgi:hypothetical protein
LGEEREENLSPIKADETILRDHLVERIRSYFVVLIITTSSSLSLSNLG